jgi:hypothetical protein
MMKKNINFTVSRIIGFYLTIIGLVILFKILFLEQFKILYIVLVLLIIPSIDFIVRALTRKRQKILLIPGITVFCTCIFFLLYLIFFESSSVTLNQIWPFLGMFPALGMIFYYIISIRKNSAIIVPGIFLVFLSVILLLFTTNIINFKFTYFLFLMIPFTIIIVGLYLLFRKEIKFLRRNKDGKNLPK